MVEGIPDGIHTITPHIVCRGAAEAIEFYKKAFGADEVARFPAPDGSMIMHAQIRIGDSIVYLTDEHPGMNPSPKQLGGSPVVLALSVEDADTAFQRAVDAGAKPTMPLEDTFWGDRYGVVEDPFGHSWSISTHVRDVTPDEITAGAKAILAGQQ